jgi:hypothetical protein
MPNQVEKTEAGIVMTQKIPARTHICPAISGMLCFEVSSAASLVCEH